MRTLDGRRNRRQRSTGARQWDQPLQSPRLQSYRYSLNGARCWIGRAVEVALGRLNL
jgi:hypothetical protein